MEFVPSTIEPYKINANFDTLSASHLADYSGPIKVIGDIFSPGNYTISLEVTGVDLTIYFSLLLLNLKSQFPLTVSLGSQSPNFVKFENYVRKIFLSIMNTL